MNTLQRIAAMRGARRPKTPPRENEGAAEREVPAHLAAGAAVPVTPPRELQQPNPVEVSGGVQQPNTVEVSGGVQQSNTVVVSGEVLGRATPGSFLPGSASQGSAATIEVSDEATSEWDESDHPDSASEEEATTTNTPGMTKKQRTTPARLSRCRWKARRSETRR